MLTVQKLGVPGGDAFLLSDDTTAFLLDSGFSFSGPQLALQIREKLGNRTLDAILLTHSHYDHAGGAMQIKKLYPDAEIIAHEYAAKVFQKEGAKRTMKEMDRAEAKNRGVFDYNDLYDALQADRTVADGDVLKLGRHSFTVLHLPGHTRCSIGFWCDDLKLLLASETLGVPASEGIVSPTYLVGYQITLDALDRAQALAPEHTVIPHNGCISGKEACSDFLTKARYWAVEAHDRICVAHSAGHSNEECIEILRGMFYTPKTALVQPIKAFDLNASYMVPMLIKEP